MALLRVDQAAWQLGGVSSAEFWAFDQAQAYCFRWDLGGAYTLAGSISIGNTVSESWTFQLPVVIGASGMLTFIAGATVDCDNTSFTGTVIFNNATFGAGGGGGATLASGATLTLATGSLVALGTAIAISGTATWAGVQTFSAGAWIGSALYKGADMASVKCALTTGFHFVLQDTDNVQVVTSVWPTYTDVLGSTVSLGTLAVGDVVVIDAGPLAYSADDYADLAIEVIDADGTTLLTEVRVASGSDWKPHLYGIHTIATAGAVTVKLGACLASSDKTLQIQQRDNAPLIRTAVYR